MSHSNIGTIGAPPFKLSALTLAIAVAIATQPKQEWITHIVEMGSAILAHL